MSKSVGIDAAIMASAENLGIILTPEALTHDRRSKTAAALSELSVSELTTPEYLEGLRMLAENASKALAAEAKATGSKQAEDLAIKFDTQIKSTVMSLSEDVMTSLSEDEKFGSSFEKIAEVTGQIMEDTLKLAEEESVKGNEDLKNILLIMAVLASALFIVHFGVSIEALSVAGVVLSYLAENKDKSPVEVAKNLCTKIVSDQEFRHAVGEKVIDAAEKVNPGLKALGLKEKALEIEQLGSNAVELYEKAKLFVAAMPTTGKAAELIGKEIFDGLSIVLDHSLKDHPEAKDKFKAILFLVQEKDNSKMLDSLSQLAKDSIEESKIGEKAKKMISTVLSVCETIDEFKKLVDTGKDSSAAEKVLAEKVAIEMKKYMHERYAKPVKELCDAAEKAGTGKLIEQLGVSKDVTKNLVSAIGSLLSSPSLAR